MPIDKISNPKPKPVGTYDEHRQQKPLRDGDFNCFSSDPGGKEILKTLGVPGLPTEATISYVAQTSSSPGNEGKIISEDIWVHDTSVPDSLNVFAINDDGSVYQSGKIETLSYSVNPAKFAKAREQILACQKNREAAEAASKAKPKPKE